MKRLEWVFGFGYLVHQVQQQQNNEEQLGIKVGIKVMHSLSDEVY